MSSLQKCVLVKLLLNMIPCRFFGTVHIPCTNWEHFCCVAFAACDNPTPEFLSSHCCCLNIKSPRKSLWTSATLNWLYYAFPYFLSYIYIYTDVMVGAQINHDQCF